MHASASLAGAQGPCHHAACKQMLFMSSIKRVQKLGANANFS